MWLAAVVPDVCVLFVHLKGDPWGDKVSMLTHTYTTRLTAHFMCGLRSDLVICKFRKIWSHMTVNVLTETKCH